MGGLDALRAAAVIAVCLFHFGLFNPGWLGVDLFFVLSGFLIGGAIIRSAESGKWSFGKFYVHRSMRILPVYYTFILLKALCVGIPLAEHPYSWTSLSSILASLTFTQTTASWYWGWQGDGKFVPGGTWSLVIEEYFYLLCPLIIVGLWRTFQSRAVLFGALVVVCCSAPAVRYFANYDYPQDDQFWYFGSWLQFRSRYDTLAFGVLAALLVLARRFSRMERVMAFVAGMSILLAVVAHLYQSRMWLRPDLMTREAALWYPFVLGAAFMMIVVAVHCNRCKSKAIVVVARLSFAIYLGHIFLQELHVAYASSNTPIVSWLSGQTTVTSAAVIAAGTMVMSYAISLLVEYPMIRMYRKVPHASTVHPKTEGARASASRPQACAR